MSLVGGDGTSRSQQRNIYACACLPSALDRPPGRPAAAAGLTQLSTSRSIPVNLRIMIAQP